jgi:hypothetical protein
MLLFAVFFWYNGGDYVPFIFNKSHGIPLQPCLE